MSRTKKRHRWRTCPNGRCSWCAGNRRHKHLRRAGVPTWRRVKRVKA